MYTYRYIYMIMHIYRSIDRYRYVSVNSLRSFQMIPITINIMWIQCSHACLYWVKIWGLHVHNPCVLSEPICLAINTPGAVANKDHYSGLGHILLSWINFNPNMNKSFTSIIKYEMKLLSCACDYLSMPGLKLKHVSKRGPWVAWGCRAGDSYSIRDIAHTLISDSNVMISCVHTIHVGYHIAIAILYWTQLW